MTEILESNSFSRYSEKIAEFYATQTRNDRHKASSQVINAIAESQLEQKPIKTVFETWRHVADWKRLHRMETDVLRKIDLQRAFDLHFLARIAEAKVKISRRLERRIERTKHFISSRAAAQAKADNRKKMNIEYANAIVRLGGRFGLLDTQTTESFKRGEFRGEHLNRLIEVEIDDGFSFDKEGKDVKFEDIGKILNNNKVDSATEFSSKITDESYSVPYDNLSFEELKSAEKLIRFFYEKGKAAEGILEGLGGINLDDVAIKMFDAAKGLPEKKHLQQETFKRKTADTLLSFSAELDSTPMIVRTMQGLNHEGIWTDTVLYPLHDADECTFSGCGYDPDDIVQEVENRGMKSVALSLKNRKI